MPANDVIVWGKWFSNTEARRVAFTDFPGRFEVSTVFTGTDHIGGGRTTARPLVFETRVQYAPDDDGTLFCWHTWVEAMRAHWTIVRNLIAEKEDPLDGLR